MRVLLDEDIPHRLRLQFPPGHEVETVEYRGWKGFKTMVPEALARIQSGEAITLHPESQ